MFDWQVFLTVAIGDFVLADPSPRRNVTTSMFGLKKTQNTQTCKNLIKNGELHRYSWEGRRRRRIVCLLVGCLTSQQQASVSLGRICPGNFMCCHTEIEVADQTFYLTQSQYTDTRPTSPSANPIPRGAWQCSHWSADF